MRFYRDLETAEAECSMRNLYSGGPTYCVASGPGDEETGEENFAVMEMAEAYWNQFPCWIVFADGTKSELIENS